MKHTYFILPFLLIACLIPEAALAANPVGATLCNIVDWFHKGTVGVGLASLSIFITAIAAMMNKISWGMFIFASLDVVLIFGAADLLPYLMGMDTCPP